MTYYVWILLSVFLHMKKSRNEILRTLIIIIFLMCLLQCKHEFCWVCLEQWKKHSSATGGYFRLVELSWNCHEYLSFVTKILLVGRDFIELYTNLLRTRSQPLLYLGWVESNSVCNHTNDKKIGRLWSGNVIHEYNYRQSWKTRNPVTNYS